MAPRQAVVRHAEGLHARPAEMVARAAARHQAEITLLREDVRADAKSILDILTLGAAEGVQLTVVATGPDAEAAAEAIARLVESDFNCGGHEPSADGAP